MQVNRRCEGWMKGAMSGVVTVVLCCRPPRLQARWRGPAAQRWCGRARAAGAMMRWRLHATAYSKYNALLLFVISALLLAPCAARASKALHVYPRNCHVVPSLDILFWGKVACKSGYPYTFPHFGSNFSGP